jgi:uncharacterized membrane protein
VDLSEAAEPRDGGDVTQSGSARTLRTISAFLAAAGIVLVVFVAGVVLREIIAPPAQTWSAWTRGSVLVVTLLALVLLLLGWMLSLRAHRARRDSVNAFLTPDERERIARAIRETEAKTSGEIVVHVTDSTQTLPTLEARKAFERRGMTRTRDRNGVLFFVSVRDHKLAVIGDKGINDLVPPSFWNDVIKHVEPRLAEGRFGEGLAGGIEMVGGELARFFPHRVDDVNELPDGITRDEEETR